MQTDINQVKSFKAQSHSFYISIFYLITGLMLVACFIVILNTYVFHLKVTTAVVSAPIETMNAPLSGYIKAIYVSEGQILKQGSRLLTIENLDLEQKFRQALVDIAQAKLTVKYTRQLLKNEQQKLTLYKKIGDDRVLAADASTRIAQQKLRSVQDDLARLKPLLKDHYISQSVWDKQTALYNNVQERLKKTQALQRLEHQALHATKHGFYFTGAKTEGIEQDLVAELHAAKNQVIINKRRANIYRKLINKLTLQAPFDAKVTQLLKTAGNTTDSSNPLLLIEPLSAPKTIVAFVTQNEVIHIKANKKATIYMPATGKYYRGKIIEINRTQGFIDELTRQYRWRDFQADRSAKITLALDERDTGAFNALSFSGMPAIVYFTRLHHWF